MMQEHLLAIGGYTKPGEPDLALLSWDGHKATMHAAVSTSGNPSFVLVHEGVLYAAHELADRVEISAWEIDGYSLRYRNAFSAAFGAGLCHLCAAGRYLVGSCWASGHFFAVDWDLQAVLWQTKLSARNEICPHAHGSAMIAPDVMACCDMGRDALGFYCTARQPPQLMGVHTLDVGNGPRQILPLEDGRFLVVCENSAAVMLCAFEEGKAKLLDTLPLPKLGSAWPGGACLTASNMLAVPLRGTNKLYRIQVQASKLRLVATCETRHDWVRSLYAPEQQDTLLAAQQKANCVEMLKLSGAPTACHVFAFAAPACIAQVKLRQG